MMNRMLRAIGVFLAMAVLVCLPAVPSVAQDDEAPRISKEELKQKLGDPSVTVIDVRYAANWKKSTQKIAGAVREDPNEISSWAGKYGKDRMLVLYCD